MRTLGSIGLLAAAAIGMAGPNVGASQVYKCSSGGNTVYQNTACDDAPDTSPHRLAPSTAGRPVPVVAPAAPAGDLSTLHQQIRAADTEERRLQADYQRAVEELRARAKSMSITEADRESACEQQVREVGSWRMSFGAGARVERSSIPPRSTAPESRL